MNVTFTALRPEHVRFITPTPVQSEEHSALLEPAGQAVLLHSMGLTGWHGSRCLGIAGVFPHWPGRAEAWALLDQRAGPHIKPIVRHMRFVLDNHAARRIEMLVKADNEIGHRLARMLQFNERTELLRKYHPNGDDMYMYARIK